LSFLISASLVVMVCWVSFFLSLTGDRALSGLMRGKCSNHWSKRTSMIYHIVCAQFELFPSFSLCSILTITCNLFYILIKLILKQADAWYLISTSFSTLYHSKRKSTCPNVEQPHHILIFDLTIHSLEGSRSINKQSSIDSFLDWEGHHWVCISTHSISSNHSNRLPK